MFKVKVGLEGVNSFILYSASSREFVWATKSLGSKRSDSDKLEVNTLLSDPQIRLDVRSNKKLNFVESELQEKNQNEATVNLR